MSSEDVVELAKEQGYEFSTEKLSQLTVKELEDIAGGTPGLTHEWPPNCCMGTWNR